MPTTNRPIEYVAANDRDCADYLSCLCGNNPVWGEGFYSASRTGLVSPAKNGGWDGRTIACLECGRLIDTWPHTATPVPTTNPDALLPWIMFVVGRIEIGPATTIPD